MEIFIEGVIINDPFNIEKFPIKVNPNNYIQIRSKLEYERRKLIDYLKHLKETGEIKSNKRPKNNKMQKHLDFICQTNREIKNSINKIITIYQ